MTAETADRLTPQQIEERAAKADLSMADVCRRARIHRGTWQRWKIGKAEPRLQLYYRLIRVIEAAELAATERERGEAA